MASANAAGITRSGLSGSHSYAVKADAAGQGPGGTDYAYADKPVVYVSWYDTLRFANWLHNGQPSGLQDTSTTEDGAYTFSGATSASARNAGATWFLPSEDEWYKAAYYDGGSSTYYDYPTGTDTIPNNNLPSADTGNSANFIDGGYTTGNIIYSRTDAGAYTLSASPYGTFDQGGNAWEWNETLISGSLRGFRGGSSGNSSLTLRSAFQSTGFNATVETVDVGFRVASVPEPSSLALGVLGVLSLAAVAWRRKR